MKVDLIQMSRRAQYMQASLAVKSSIKPKLFMAKPRTEERHPKIIDRISSGENEIVINTKEMNYNVHHGSHSSTFATLNLRQDVIQGLEDLKIFQPTVIQMLGIPMVLDGKNVFCAAQTGSGKTLVYAATVISNLQNEFGDGFIGRLSRPRAIVVAPSRELALQILKVFKSFSYFAPFRSVGLIGQNQKKWTREYVKGLVDVVVGTPLTILKYQKKGLLNLSDLRYLVLDEADTLLDENFRDDTIDILNLCQFREQGMDSVKKPVQCILTAATLPPKGILSGYKDYIPNLELCQSNLHKVLPQVKHTFVKTAQDKKSGLVVSRLQRLLEKDSRKCIVFCNTWKSCNWLSLILDEHSIIHSKLHGNMNPQVRFKDFERYFSDETRVLVCTDIASRGLDITDVTLVINFDCPFTTTDYIHRSGRTGRARQSHPDEAEAITYITQNKEVLFAQKIQMAAEKNEGLDDVRSKKNSLKVRHEKDMEKYVEMNAARNKKT